MNKKEIPAKVNKKMFNTAQTRLFIFLSMLITVLLCFIGLNWNVKEDREIEKQARLIVPEIEIGFVRKTPIIEVDKKQEKIIDLTVDEPAEIKKQVEEPAKIFPGALEDTGKTIILD